MIAFIAGVFTGATIAAIIISLLYAGSDRR